MVGDESHREVAEDIIRLVRNKYDEFSVIVPGCAKSAGTIMAMAADDILMGPASSLGPIDAQLRWQGKVFSADALLEGFEKIKKEVSETGQLSKAYIPILQGISPGELQSAENALNFAKVLVTEWLSKYKFRSWDTHSSTGEAVTALERRARAESVAQQLCDHGRWLTHGRSLKIEDLEAMRLRITDFSQNADLHDAVRRYHTLLQMSFATNIYKIFETPKSQVLRFISPQAPAPQAVGGGSDSDVVILDGRCDKCANPLRIQVNLNRKQPLQEGCLPYPSDDKLKCPSCSAEIHVGDARRQVEAQSKKKVVV